MTLPDPEKIAELLKDCARDFILPRFKLLQDHEISTKTGPQDLVTQADLDVETHLAKILPDFLPGSLVIGEEGVSQGTASLDVLDDTTRKLWIVDPVDGTYNFVHGRPEFGIMLACIIGGETCQAWIYDVPGDVMTAAEKGAGTTREGVRLRIVEKTAPEDLVLHINPRYFPKAMQPKIREVLENFHKIESLGSAAHEYTRIAAGLSDAAIYGRTRAWDHLPGVLIVQEAGGYAAKFDGTPYTPRNHEGNLLVTGGRESWKAAHAVIAKALA